MVAQRRRLKAIAAEPVRESPPDLRDAVRVSVDAMDWLKPSDQAIRALALRQAEEIEKAVARADELGELRCDLSGDDSAYRRLQKLEAMCDVTKTVGWLGPQLQGVLRDLGGTPAARQAMKPGQAIGGRLAQLRADAAGKHDS